MSWPSSPLPSLSTKLKFSATAEKAKSFRRNHDCITGASLNFPPLCLHKSAKRCSFASGNQQFVTDVNCSESAFGIISHKFGSRSLKEIQMAAPAVARSQLLRRRSTRITLNTPVSISGEDRAKASFSLSAKAVNLSKHGAAI